MGKLRVSRIENASTTDGGIDIDTSGHVQLDGVQMPTAGPLSNRRININGAMTVAQRGTSFTGKTGSTFGIDRYETKMSSAGTWTLSQSSTAPEGFANSYKVECTTANSSLSSGSLMYIQQRIEGQDLIYLKKGTSNAEKVTMSFWVRSDKTGTYILEILDNDNTRHIAKSYSISAADTWEHKTITFDGDTSGTLTYDNTASLEFNFWLVAGSDYDSGTLPTSWASTTDANRAVGQLNLADTVGNEFYITGVQLEVGDKATPFEHRSYGDELARCQRYYFDTVGGVSSGNLFTGFSSATTNAIMFVEYPTFMRASPDFDSTGDFQVIDGGSHVVTGFTTESGNTRAIRLNCTTTGLTQGDGCMLRDGQDTTAKLMFSAEL